MLQIVMLGGYLACNHDPPPGNMIVWRGLTRLHDIALGISIGGKPTIWEVESFTGCLPTTSPRLT
ncbi:hypothetical protein, partial [Enterococcus faecium]